MYVTRPLKQFIDSPDTLSWPPEGPNSGYLVLDEDDQQTYRSSQIKCIDDTPLPQNKDIRLDYEHGSDEEDMVLIPVLNQPLSSNRYYVIKPHGKNKGQALASSREEDIGTSCCGPVINDVESRPLDPNDIYQQFEITKLPKLKPRHKRVFNAKSSAHNGLPPYSLRRGFTIRTRSPEKNLLKEEALGMNTSLQGVLPSDVTQILEIGRWYCPFMFVAVKHGTQMRDQMKLSMFYEMTLERKWDKIFGCYSDNKENNVVVIDVIVEKEEIFVFGERAGRKRYRGDNGMIWFESEEGLRVGLRKEIVERMKWEEERNGWSKNGEQNEEWLKIEEKLGDYGINKWREFSCYMLVERFVLKRWDRKLLHKRRAGSVVLSYDFKHTQHIRCTWD